MANRIEVTKLLDGPRHLIFHVYLLSDGTEGDLTEFTLIDPANESGSAKHYTVEDVTWGFNGFSANLEFDLLGDNNLIWVLPPSTGNYVDFKKYGGLKDRGNPLDASGKIYLTTTGFVDIGDEGSLIIKVRKN